MQMPPQFALGSAIFFEHVEVFADHHGNSFGLQLMHDMIKYARSNAIYYGGSALALLWVCPHQFNGDDGLRSKPWYYYGMRCCSTCPSVLATTSCCCRERFDRRSVRNNQEESFAGPYAWRQAVREQVRLGLPC
jgi:hypothetical protein